VDKGTELGYGVQRDTSAVKRAMVTPQSQNLRRIPQKRISQ